MYGSTFLHEVHLYVPGVPWYVSGIMSSCRQIYSNVTLDYLGKQWISHQRILTEWFQSSKDLSEWNDKISTLEPPKQDSVFNFDFLDSLESDSNLSNDQATELDERDQLSPLPNTPSAEPYDDLDRSDAYGREESRTDPSHRGDKFEPHENQIAPQTWINSPTPQPQQIQDSETPRLVQNPRTNILIHRLHIRHLSCPLPIKTIDEETETSYHFGIWIVPLHPWTFRFNMRIVRTDPQHNKISNTHRLNRIWIWIFVFVTVKDLFTNFQIPPIQTRFKKITIETHNLY
jgi:hypothetical protein